MTCEPWDVIVVPFPFTERAGDKRRPALVLSRTAFNERGHSVLAMITSTGHAPWPGDTDIQHLDEAGLRTPCLVRLKLFTLDNRLIIRTIGRLSTDDARRAAEQLRLHLA